MINQLIKYDSFKIRILQEQIDTSLLPNELGQNIIKLYALTGQIKEEVKAEPLKLTNDNGITYVTLAIENIRTKDQQRYYVTAKVTSKLLQTNYYQGININTMPNILNYFNSVGIMFDMNMLLNAELTDIDFCKDIALSKDQYKHLFDYVSKYNKDIRKHPLNSFNQNTNTGFSFNINRKTATEYFPFWKVYNKYLDSISQKHIQFFSHYFIDTAKDLHRIEFTLKNMKHFKKYNLGNTLKDFINLSQEKLENIAKDFTSIYLNNNMQTIENEDKEYQSVAPVIMKYLLQFGAAANIPFNKIVELVLSEIESPRTKLDIKNKLMKINQKLINESVSYSKNVELVKVLEELYIV
jgi:hypothetical protein